TNRPPGPAPATHGHHGSTAGDAAGRVGRGRGRPPGPGRDGSADQLPAGRRPAGGLGAPPPPPAPVPLPASGPVPSGVCEAGECSNKLYWFGMEGYVVPSGLTGAPGSLGALSVLASDDPRIAAGGGRGGPARRRLPAPPAPARGP